MVLKEGDVGVGSRRGHQGALDLGASGICSRCAVRRRGLARRRSLTMQTRAQIHTSRKAQATATGLAQGPGPSGALACSRGLTRGVHNAARRVAALSGEVQRAAGAARELGPKLGQL